MPDPAEPSGEREALASMKAQVYLDPRPFEEIAEYYDWPMTHRPDWVYTVVRIITSLYVLIIHRETCIDRRNIPKGGPLIFAPNHASNIDHFFLGVFTARSVQFMAKSQLYKGWFAWVMKHGGVFPVRRGQHDERTIEVAHSILERGGTICTYCEGGRSRSGKLADRAKPGIGRLALESGAPVVPAAILGSHRVRNWKRLQFPKVTGWYGEPLQYDVVENPTREQQQAVADEIFGRVRAMHDELSERGVRAVRADRRRARRARTTR